MIRSTLLALILMLAASPARSQLAPAGSDSDSAPRIGAPHQPATEGPRLDRLRLGVSQADAMEQDTVRRRAKAVELSDAYAVRLKIHQIGSYVELPIFAAEVLVGQKLYSNRNNGVPSSSGLRSAHSALAVGIGALFTVNTVTGLWNLIESWKDPTDRTRRTLHSVTMLLADAGFLITASKAPGDDDGFEREGGDAASHKAWAIGSSSLAAASTVMMWLWKN